VERLLEQEIDSLASLEERIHRAVELVAELRRDNENLQAQLKEALADRDAAVREGSDARNQAARLSDELAALRDERGTVRSRIEKLLSQMDALSAG
jgi:chromosome segregation ATPase